MRFEVQNMIVAGAAGNLGTETVKKFLRDGKNVVSFVQSQEHCKSLSDSLEDTPNADKHSIYYGDLSQGSVVSDLISKAKAEMGSVDALISTAGGFRFTSIESSTEEDFDFLFSANIKSAYLLARELIPHMKSMKKGRILFVSALGTLSAGAPGMGIYLASKSALNVFVQSLAKELVHDGITVNALLPSVIDSLANRKAMPKEDFSKWVLPEHLIDIMDSLLSHNMHTVTGSLVSVPGKL